MGVAVDEGIKTSGVGNDLLAGPGRGRGVHAQVAQADDHIGQALRLVNGLLHGAVELLAVLAAQDVVDVLGLGLVHEVGRGGLGKRLGRGDAHKGNAHTTAHEHLDFRQHPQIGAQVHPVAGQVREVGIPHELFGTVQAIVELMVAGGGNIVTGGVHQLNDGSALVHGAVSGALHMVTGVHQQDLFACVLIALLQGGNGRIGELRGLLVDVSVHVVGVQDGDLGFFTGPAGRRSRGPDSHGGGSGGDTGGLQEIAAGDKMFHGKTTSSFSGI